MYKKIFIIVIGVLTLILSTVFIVLFSKSDLEKGIVQLREFYCECWELDKINENPNTKKIKINFSKIHSKTKQEQIESISDVYREIQNTIFYNDRYKDYSIEINFMSEANSQYFSLCNITSNDDALQIHCNTGFTLKDISRKFPEARQLILTPAWFDDIKEIQGFTNLEYIYISNPISESEAKYINSIYPMCNLEYNLSR